MHTNPVSWKRNASLFMFSQALSLFGTSLVHYAVVWHITLAARSGWMMGLLTAAGTLPTLVASPFGGVWADRYDKKRLICVADGAIAVTTLAMAAFLSIGVEHFAVLLLCLAVRAAGQGVQQPAVSSLLPSIVPHEHLTRVNGINGSVQSMVMLASPMAGGALLMIAPIQTILYIDVFTAAIAIVTLLWFVQSPVAGQRNDSRTGTSHCLTDVRDGLQYMAGQVFLKRLLVVYAIYCFLAAPSAVLTPLQVARNWGDEVWNVVGGISFGAEQRIAIAETAFFAGMVMGGVFIGIWGGFRNRSHTLVLSTCLFGVCAFGLGALSVYWLYIACMSIAGFGISLMNAPLMTTLQLNIDPAFMGRAFSVMSMLGNVATPLAMILWGPLADYANINLILVATGACLFILGITMLFDKAILEAGAVGAN